MNCHWIWIQTLWIMEIGGGSSSRTPFRSKAFLKNVQVDDYPFDIQMFDRPPSDIVSLQEFYDFAVDRLKGMMFWIFLVKV